MQLQYFRSTKSIQVNNSSTEVTVECGKIIRKELGIFISLSFNLFNWKFCHLILRMVA